MKPQKLHTQERRDFQPVADPAVSVGKFKSYLRLAKEKVSQKPVKAMAFGKPTDTHAAEAAH